MHVTTSTDPRPKKTFPQPRRKWSPWESHWAAVRVAVGEFSTNSSPPGHSWRELPRARFSITDTLPIPDSNPRPPCDERTGERGRHNNTIVFGRKTWAQETYFIASQTNACSSRIEFEPPLHAPSMLANPPCQQGLLSGMQWLLLPWILEL
jgi:hypothetical protein